MVASAPHGSEPTESETAGAESAETAETELRRLLEATLDLAPAARRAYLEAHAARPEIAREVEALIGRESSFGDFLQRPAVAELEEGVVQSLLYDVEDAAPAEPTTIGSYRVRHSLGEGGMGRVYLAEQQEPVERKVALKLVHRMLGTEAAARFRLERMALARLSHPNIARLYEAGATPEGRPFVAMELVEGPSITRFCDQRRLPVSARLRLFIAVCRGAQHAHQKQILHRDLKPSNILVTEIDGEPVAKIIDFGIAKSLGPARSEEAQVTGDRLLGTPQYMSPEALERAQDEDLDTRTDVYSLGVVLYELLAGALPFTTPSSDLTRLMREILSQTPARPSARFAELDEASRRAIAADRGSAPERLREALEGDLDCLVMKAMAREREERYGSAAALADELERVLRQEPILARPPSWSYRLGKWAQRHRLATALVATTAVGLMLATLLTSIALVRTRRAEQHSRYEARVSRQSLDFLVGVFEAASPEQARGEPVDATRLLEVGVERIRGADLEPLPRAQILLTLADVHLRLGLYPKALELAAESLEIRERELSPDAAEVLESVELLANVERRAGHLERAEPLLERVVAGAEANGDPLALADALNSLGNLRWRQQRSSDAERLYLRSLELRRRALGPNASEVAASHNNLGALYYSDGRYAEAEPHLRRAAALLEERLGPRHPRVADALGNLGIVLNRLGQLSEAETLQQQVLETRLEVLGADHPDTAAAWHNLATVRVDLGKFREAEEDYRRALDVRRRILGEDHVETIKTLSNLGLLAWRLGSFEEAETLLAKVLVQRQRISEAGDAALLRSRRNLANVWRDTGRLAAAREALESVLEAQRARFGATHRDIAQTLHHLGVTARLEGRFDEAEKLLRESLEVRGRLAAPEEKSRAETLFELGELERSRGREAEARAAHLGALELRRRVLPDGHPDLLASMRAVADSGS